MRERPPDLFYERLRILLDDAERRGASIQDVAEKIGVHWSRLYRWRKGIDGPSGASLAALADYAHWTMDYLWGMTDDPGPAAIRPASPRGGPEPGLEILAGEDEEADGSERAAQ